MNKRLPFFVGFILLVSTFCYSQESNVQDTVFVVDTTFVYDTIRIAKEPIIEETKSEELKKDGILSFNEISLLTADYQTIGISTHISYKSYYLLITTGTNFNLSTPLIGGIGFGKEIDLSSNIYLTPEIVSMWYFPFGRNYAPQNNNHIRLGVAYQLSPKFAVKITPSVYCGWRGNVNDNTEYNEISHIISPFVPFYATETSPSSTFDIGAGGSIDFIYHIR